MQLWLETNSIESEEQMMEKEAIISITEKDWQQTISHVKKEEADYWKNDGLIEEEIEDILISFEDESDSEDGSDNDNSSMSSSYVYTSVITLVTFQLYFMSGTFTLSPTFSFALDLLASDDRTAQVSAVSCFLSLCLLTIHSWHRLYETWFISVFSDSRINILHYAVGYAHYIGAVAAILAESPGFTDTKNDIREWIANDEVDEITDTDIVEMVTQGEVIEEEDDRKNLLPHSGGLKTIEAALQYISQQEEVISSACSGSGQIVTSRAIKLAELANLILYTPCFSSWLRLDYRGGKIVTHRHGIPHGGWFELVSSPHLLAEVIMYLALTIILWGAHTWPFVFLWVLSNQEFERDGIKIEELESKAWRINSTVLVTTLYE
uniref:Polyprenal reductase n=1 Tax=Timema tahoe TaxID=61484 RepID=A0A7R9IPN9_9NEOP|nr:unnamed protein product [Timema tahoe]